MLESDDWETRVKALSALREFGSIAHSAAEAVALLTVDSNRNVRFFALQALGKLGPSDSLALSALLPALTDSWPAARTAAALALRDLDCPGSPESLTTLLLERLRYEPVGERSSSNLRRSLAAALGECGELDERVYPAFLEMARADEDGDLRANAVGWLGEHVAHHNDDERLIHILITALDDHRVRHEVPEAMRGVGPAAVPFLNRRIFSDPAVVRGEAVCTDTLSAGANAALLSLLRIYPYEHDDPEYSPSNTIASLGPLAVRTLLPIYSDLVIPDARRYALLQLGDSALPVLLCMLEGDSLSGMFNALNGLRYLVQPSLDLPLGNFSSLLPTLGSLRMGTGVPTGFKVHARGEADFIIGEIRQRTAH